MSDSYPTIANHYLKNIHIDVLIDSLFPPSIGAMGAYPNNIDLAGMPSPQWLDVGGTEFPIVDIGAGEPVLLVHGAWADHRIWCGVWKPISQQARFMAVTLRHFGPFDWPDDKPFSRQVHTDDLIAILNKIGQPVHLVGWSYAGGILLRTTATAPELVRSLTIFDPSYECEDPPDSGALRQALDVAWTRLEPAYERAEAGDLSTAMSRGLDVVYSLDPDGFFDLHPDFQQVHLENGHTILPDFHAEPAAPITTAEFAAIRCPTMVLNGELSSEHYRLMAEQTAGNIENARLVSSVLRSGF